MSAGGQTTGQAGFVLREPEDRFVFERKETAAEHAGETHHVGGTGHGTEQVQEIEDFLLGVESVTADQVVVDAVAAERVFV